MSNKKMSEWAAVGLSEKVRKLETNLFLRSLVTLICNKVTLLIKFFFSFANIKINIVCLYIYKVSPKPLPPQQQVDNPAKRSPPQGYKPRGIPVPLSFPNDPSFGFGNSK